MRPEDEGALEEQFVGDTRVRLAGVEREIGTPFGVLVSQPESQELRREEGHVGSDGPLEAGTGGIFGPVEAQAERPPAPGLHFAPAVEAEAVERAAAGAARRDLRV